MVGPRKVGLCAFSRVWCAVQVSERLNYCRILNTTKSSDNPVRIKAIAKENESYGAEQREIESRYCHYAYQRGGNCSPLQL